MKILRKVLISALTLLAFALPAQAVSAIKEVDIPAAEYGYGKYLVSVKGVGYDGVYDEDSVLFYYLPVYAESSVDELTGKYYVDLDYSAAEGETEPGKEVTGEVAKIVINVYDESGKLVEALSPMTILPPTTRVEIPFAEKDLPSGKYTLKISAYDLNDEELYKAFELVVEYHAAEIPDAGAPDTGGLFQNLNISKEDYLVSGLIVFFVLGVVAFGVVARNKKTDSKKHRR